MSKVVHVLDYGTGNLQSVLNAIKHVGWHVERVKSPQQLTSTSTEVKVLIFPGVGAFGNAVTELKKSGYWDAFRSYIQSGRPFMGICIGMQVLFAMSEESPLCKGLAILPGQVVKFNDSSKCVPHMGWNRAQIMNAKLPFLSPQADYYFVHSYAVILDSEAQEVPSYVHSVTRYGDQVFVSSIQLNNVFATQFHPEKSGTAGLAVIKAFLDYSRSQLTTTAQTITQIPFQLNTVKAGLSKRIIACLDVRANDAGDLVVTKGDQYDVRDHTDTQSTIRNLGKPVDLACRYYAEGADEITFLNITSFRSSVLSDLPMLQVLKRTSETVFVPLTIGGGIRACTELDSDGNAINWSAVQVADEYFRSGADKVSIGSDAVYSAEQFWGDSELLTIEKVKNVNNFKKKSSSSISEISAKYGCQAVVISVDPKRVYVKAPTLTKHATIETKIPGPNGETYCWYQCTVKGGRESRDLDVVELVVACERMGAGEILLNCMDKDGTKTGFDIELIRQVKESVRIPVIASSGAGTVEHFASVFGVGEESVDVEAALAAGIFHRHEVPLKSVKQYLSTLDVCVRKAQ